LIEPILERLQRNKSSLVGHFDEPIEVKSEKFAITTFRDITQESKQDSSKKKLQIVKNAEHKAIDHFSHTLTDTFKTTVNVELQN